MEKSRRQRRFVERFESRMLLSTTIYVDANASSPTHDGISWPTAFTDLQQALAIASAGDEIHVADGVYKPTSGADRSMSFVLTDATAVLGGFAGDGAANPDERDTTKFQTILSGDIGTPGDAGDNSDYVVRSRGGTPALDGFTITSAHAAGMMNDASSPAIRDCTFVGNGVGSYGAGGIYDNASSPTLVGCRFFANFGLTSGVTNVSSSPHLFDCIFVGNSGYLVYTIGASSSPELVNCTMVSNAGYQLLKSVSGKTTLENCIIWDNTGPASWLVFDSTAGNWSIDHCDVQIPLAGPGSMNAHPLFMRNPNPGGDAEWGTGDDDYGDLRLQACSPAVDAGNNGVLPRWILTDLGGSARYVDVEASPDVGTGPAPIVDIGAYEAVNALSATAGEPYFVVEGGTITLSGRGASDAPGPVQYAWEWDGDGLFDDASGPAPAFSTAGIPAASQIDVQLRVTDSASRSITSRTTLNVVPSTIYVDARANGAASGVSWADALTSLGPALSWAINGTSIHVAQGTYTVTTTLDATATLTLKNGISLMGGYAGLGAANPDDRNVVAYESILSGDIGIIGSSADNTNIIVTANGCDSSAILDGFTLTAASGRSTFAILVIQAAPTITHCTIRDNSETAMGIFASAPELTDCIFANNIVPNRDGGAIYAVSSSPKLLRCDFTQNIASGGGAVSCYGGAPTLEYCTFTDNFSGVGGAVTVRSGSSAMFSHCVFEQNSVAGNGGAVAIYSAPSVFTDCVFIRNNATLSGSFTGYGGAAVIEDESSYPNGARFERCQFLGNSAVGQGGAVYAGHGGLLLNCIFVGNSADYGGSVRTGLTSTLLANCTIVANVANYGAGLFSFSTTVNSIIWANTGVSSVIVVSRPTFCDLQYGYPGAGNLSVDPLFVRNPSPGSDGTWGTADDDYGDLRLQANSPCIDAGSNALVPAGVTIDIVGNPRFVDVPNVRDYGAIVDMGAYESQTSINYLFDAPKPTVQVSFAADIDPVTLQVGDLTVVNVVTGVPLNLSSGVRLSYDSSSRIASWVFASPLPDGDYRVTLPAGNVTDTLGAPLPADLIGNAYVFGGDANRDRVVDINDLSILAKNWNGGGKVFSQGDFNYDGEVDAKDLGILSSHWQQTLPPPAPTAPVRAPTRTPTRIATLVF